MGQDMSAQFVRPAQSIERDRDFLNMPESNACTNFSSSLLCKTHYPDQYETTLEYQTRCAREDREKRAKALDEQADKECVDTTTLQSEDYRSCAMVDKAPEPHCKHCHMFIGCPVVTDLTHLLYQHCRCEHYTEGCEVHRFMPPHQKSVARLLDGLMTVMPQECTGYKYKPNK